MKMEQKPVRSGMTRPGFKSGNSAVGAVLGGAANKMAPQFNKVGQKPVGGFTQAPAGGMKKMAKGGVTRADGVITKAHTKGKMVAMKRGGKAC